MGQRNPGLGEIKASFAVNSKLARAVHPLMTWCAYDKYQAHTWALRLIAADPATGEDAAVALVNYDTMVDGAKESYRNKPNEKRRYDAVAAAYSAWKANQHQVEAA